MRNKFIWVLLTGLILAFAGCDDDGGNNSNNINNINNNNESCGNGVIEGDEICDATALNGNDCTTIGHDFTGGELFCNASCDGWDTSSCTGGSASCGDGIIEGDEICDGTNLDGNDCTTIGEGFTGGTLYCNQSCDGWDTSSCTTDATAICGDSIVEGTEVCDGTNLDGEDCTTIGGGFTGGTLACDGCDWDTSSCTTDATAICGDSIVEGTEVCDGTNLDGEDCTTIGGGFTGGTLACDGCDWDTSLCTGSVPGVCGDGTLDGTEVCDGENLDGATCGDFGYSDGYLFCNNSCDGYYLGSCNNYGTTCGNGIVEANEQCDGTNLNGASCWVPGTSGGTISCTDNCTLDYSACEEDYCELAGWYGDGYCDDCPNLGGTIDPDCAAYCSLSDSYCLGYYQPNLGTTTCNYYEGVFDPDCAVCGDGVAEGGETCDGSDLGGLTCESLGYSSGTIACSDNCTVDLSGCSGATCGDNIAAPTETCDGTDLREKTCTSFGFASGDLDCNVACDGYDTSACVAPTCGDGVVEGDEVCDGTNLNGWTCAMIPGDYGSGDLACNGTCDGWDTSGCVAPVCGNGVVEGDEVCDGTNLNGWTCAMIPGDYVMGDLACNATCGWDDSGCQVFTCGAVDLGTFSSGTAISETGNICDGTSTTLYSTSGSSCIGYEAPGSEKVFQLVVSDGDTINLTYTSDNDNMLYLIETCDDLDAATCLVGVDDDYGSTNTESTSYTNSTGAAQTVFIVLDLYDTTCSGSAINYTLDIN